MGTLIQQIKPYRINTSQRKFKCQENKYPDKRADKCADKCALDKQKKDMILPPIWAEAKITKILKINNKIKIICNRSARVTLQSNSATSANFILSFPSIQSLR